MYSKICNHGNKTHTDKIYETHFKNEFGVIHRKFEEMIKTNIFWKMNGVFIEGLKDSLSVLHEAANILYYNCYNAKVQIMYLSESAQLTSVIFFEFVIQMTLLLFE